MYRAMAEVPFMGSPEFTDDPYLVQEQSTPIGICGINFSGDGHIYEFDNGGIGGIIGDWDSTGLLDIADYDFRADPVSTDTILVLPYQQNIWHFGGIGPPSFHIATGTNKFWIGTIRIRPTGGGADIDTSPNCEFRIT